MINKDKNCKSCAHLDGAHCKKWDIDIPNIHSFSCSNYSFKKEFENKGKVIFDRPTQELRYEYDSFRVADMEYPNYITMELYTEGSDWFRFNYYYVLKDTGLRDGHVFNVIGNLSVGRMIRNKKIGSGTYVDKPYWSWKFDDENIKISDGYLKSRGDEDNEFSIKIEKLKTIIELVERVEKSGNPLNVPDNVKVQFIRSETYNDLVK